jgi:hypothetical protein
MAPRRCEIQPTKRLTDNHVFLGGTPLYFLFDAKTPANAAQDRHGNSCLGGVNEFKMLRKVRQ